MLSPVPRVHAVAATQSHWVVLARALSRKGRGSRMTNERVGYIKSEAR